MNTITDEQLQAFCEAVDAKRIDYFKKQGFSVDRNDPTVFERGKVNARIVTSENGGTSRSAYCFIRLSDGAILKAAGWKAPAKGVRGNIKNGASDVTAYGAVYWR